MPAGRYIRCKGIGLLASVPLPILWQGPGFCKKSLLVGLAPATLLNVFVRLVQALCHRLVYSCCRYGPSCSVRLGRPDAVGGSAWRRPKADGDDCVPPRPHARSQRHVDWHRFHVLMDVNLSNTSGAGQRPYGLRWWLVSDCDSLARRDGHKQPPTRDLDQDIMCFTGASHVSGPLPKRAGRGARLGGAHVQWKHVFALREASPVRGRPRPEARKEQIIVRPGRRGCATETPADSAANRMRCHSRCRGWPRYCQLGWDKIVRRASTTSECLR